MNILPDTLQKLYERFEKTQSKEAAQIIVEEYFSCFKLKGFQQQLWTLTVGLLTNDEMQQAEKGRGRHDIIFFYEFTLLFVKAVDLLREKTGS